MAQQREDGNVRLLYADDLDNTPTAEWFAPPAAADAAATGRGAAWFVNTPSGPAVLRLYRRGGMAARFSEKTYLYTGEDSVRSFAEFRLTELLYHEGFPVPRPLAAAYERKSRTYQAALLTARVPDTETLATRLKNGPRVPESAWDALGEILGRLHARGVYHADLNAHNILIDAHDAITIIDFDRGRLRSGDGWRQRNIQRLERSLRKLRCFDSESFASMIAAHAVAGGQSG